MTRLTDGGRITQPLVSRVVVTDGAWHCLRLVWDGSARHLYVDGKEVAADKRKLNALRSSTADFYFGAGKDLEAGSFWSGLLDDIRVLWPGRHALSVRHHGESVVSRPMLEKPGA